MDLGMKRSDMEMPAVATKEAKNEVHYPSCTIEKKVGDYEPGDTFTAIVKFRVKSVTSGKEYGNDPNHHRCTLELLSMDGIKAKGKGLPQHG